MDALWNHINTLKAKPHDVRKQVALTYAAIGTGIVAVIWLTGSLATGAFAIHTTEESAQPTLTTATPTAGASLNLAGAAAALPSDTSGPAKIQIIDTTTHSPVRQPQETTIPF